MLIFSYPVYTFLAPCQMHMFIDLVKKSGIDFSEKFATQISTSKHFYDVTAHRYIKDNAQDMKLKYINGLSADMDDIITPKGQKEAVDFFRYTLECVKRDIYEPLPKNYEAGNRIPVTKAGDECISRHGDVVIVTDCNENDTQLKGMMGGMLNEGMLMPYQKALGLEMELVNKIKAESEKKKEKK